MLGRSVGLVFLVMSPMLSGCQTSVAECEPPEWYAASLEELPPLRPEYSTDLGVQVRESDSVCDSPVLSFEIPGGSNPETRRVVVQNALANGWVADSAKGCLTKQLAGTVTALEFEGDRGLYSIHAYGIDLDSTDTWGCLTHQR